MAKDPLDDLLRFGAGFDWITPLSDIIVGYNTIEMDETIDKNACKAKVEELKRQGINCRVDFTGNGWRVISRRK